jgi:hypothetical protein
VTKDQVSKYLISGVLGVSTLLAPSLFWGEPYLVLVMVCIFSVLMLAVEYTKTAIFLYIIVAILGPLAEVVAIISGVWVYTEPQIMGIPLWLPLVWGNSALFILRIHAFLKECILK